MTVQEVISLVEETKPSAYSTNTIVSWLNECESNLIMRTSGDIARKIKYPDDAGRELSAPLPFEKIYVEFITAKIDYQDQQFQAYQNSMAIYNATEIEYLKYWERHKYD
ncbi:MAG: hypothetical protein MJ236_01175 [Clostridia bacterium]|nr:hypothetical protein [Clostridia bacterium]